MKLTIIYKPSCKERPWLIKREGGKYGQHAHMHSKRDAEKVRNLIDIGKRPYSKDFLIAAKRLLTEEEFKQLKKKSRHHNAHKAL